MNRISPCVKKVRPKRNFYWRPILLFAVVFFLPGCEDGSNAVEGELQVEYHPPIIPLGISIDTHGNVAISTGMEFATPIGTFKIGASASHDLFPDKRTLTVRYDGRDTVYELVEGERFTVEFDEALYEKVILEHSAAGNIFLELRSTGVGIQSPRNDLTTEGSWVWDQPSKGATTTVQDGRLSFEVKGTNIVRQYYMDKNFADFRARVEVRQTGGATSSGFGFVFRHQGHRNCYRFTVTGNGEFEFGKELEDEWHYFSGYEGKIRHQCIKRNGSWNTLELVCDESTLTAFINGCEVANVTDSSFRSGHVGFLVGTEEDGSSATAEFRNFVLDEQ